MITTKTSSRKGFARRITPSGFLTNISIAWKMVLMVTVLFLGIAGITISAYLGIQSLRYQFSNIYDFMLIPITSLDEVPASLHESQYYFVQVLRGDISAEERANDVAQIQADNQAAEKVIARYDTEWVTTSSPQFTQDLKNAGKLELQQQEVAALASYHTAYDAYKAAVAAYVTTVQAGNPAANLADEAIKKSEAADTEIHKLIDVNNLFADFSNTSAQAAFQQSLLNGGIALGISVIVGLFISYLLVVSITGRLGDLTRSAAAMQEGNLDQTVVVAGRDEVSLLGTTFNKMAAQLREFIATLEQRVAERTRALATSAEVSRRLSTILDREQLVREVIEQMQSAFGYYHTQIYLTDPSGKSLIMAGGTGEAGAVMVARGHSIPRGKGLVGRAAETNTVVLVANTAANSEWLPNPLLPETKSELAVPIALGGQVIGVLDVQHDIVGGLQQQDADLIQSIANQVAIALQNIQSTEIITKRATELQTVAAISTAAATISDTQKMLESVVHLTQRRFGLYHAHVFTYDENTSELQIAACGWKEGDEHEGTHGTTTIPLGQEQSLVARAARARQAVIVNDVRSDPSWLPNPLLPDTASEMAVPMIVGDQILGVLDVQSERLNAFTEEDANIQTTLASQVATALQNARSFTQAQRQAEHETAVNLIAQRIQNTISIESALQIAARELGHALGMKPTLVALDPAALSGDGRTQKENAS